MKTVLITGAGRGLGKAIAETFAENGCRVVATDIDNELLENFRDKTSYEVYQLDVTDPISIRAVREDLHQKEIKIDILVNNAGIFDLFPLCEANISRLRRVIEVNTLGPATMIREFLPDLLETHGRVIQVSSESVRFPALFQPYQVSKIALEAYSRSVRQELALKGVKLVMIRAGAMNTQIVQGLTSLRNPVDQSIFEKEFEQFVKETKKHILRVVSPAKVAKVVYKASVSKKPRYIYNINHNPWLIFLSLIPDRLMVKVLKVKFKGKL